MMAAMFAMVRIKCSVGRWIVLAVSAFLLSSANAGPIYGNAGIAADAAGQTAAVASTPGPLRVEIIEIDAAVLPAMAELFAAPGERAMSGSAASAVASIAGDVAEETAPVARPPALGGALAEFSTESYPASATNFGDAGFGPSTQVATQRGPEATSDSRPTKSADTWPGIVIALTICALVTFFIWQRKRKLNARAARLRRRRRRHRHRQKRQAVI